MRFVVEGIGKIGRAEILLDGITLIVGENNTGKSTIGKALFAHVNSVCGFSRRMKATYRNELSHILFYHAIMEYRDIIGFVHDLIDEMIDVLPGKELNPSSLARWIKHLVDGGGMSADDYETERVEKYLKWLSGRSRQAISFRGQICKLFGIERDQWEQMFLSDDLNAVFANQPQSLLPGALSLSTFLEDNGKPVEDGELDALFLGDVETFPSLMSSIDENEDGFRRSSTKYVTRENRQVIATHRSSRPLSENDNRLLAMLDEIYAGTVERQPGKASILHETFKTTEELGVSTSSMGVRPILLSKHLIARNIADGRLVLILDEPEVHLHPAWQVAYARVLSAMSELLGVRILITTHSPYFMKAMLINGNRQIRCYGTDVDENGRVSLELLDKDGVADRYESMIVPFDELAAEQLEAEIAEEEER